MEYLIGLFIGWTWLDFYGSEGEPQESGQWFFTEAGAMRGWRYAHDDGGYWSCVVLRQDRVKTFMDAWTLRHATPDDTIYPTFDTL